MRRQGKATRREMAVNTRIDKKMERSEWIASAIVHFAFNYCRTIFKTYDKKTGDKRVFDAAEALAQALEGMGTLHKRSQDGRKTVFPRTNAICRRRRQRL